MGWAARANPTVQTVQRIRDYVRAHPEIAEALYRKQALNEPLPPGTINAAVQALATS